MHRGRDHCRGGEGEEQEPAAVHERFAVADGRVRDDDGAKGENAGVRDRTRALHVGASREEHREQGADQQRVHACVGAEVRPCRVVSERGHERGGSQCRARCNDDDQCPPAASDAKARSDDQWPHQVELLLDRE